MSEESGYRIAIVVIAVVLGLGASGRGHDDSFLRDRVDLCVYVTPEFNCVISAFTSTEFSDFDLVLERTVQIELGLDHDVTEQLDKHREGYWKKVTEEDSRSHSPGINTSSKVATEINAEIDEILACLTIKERKRLAALGRYLYFRQFGPAHFYDTYCQDASPDKVSQTQMKRRARIIWTDGLRKGTEAWRHTLARIADVLPSSAKAEFDANCKFFEASIWADIALIEFQKPTSEQRDEFKGKDLEQEYEARLSKSETFWLAIDGQWRRQVVETPEVFNNNLQFILS
jgi:hypothetical protein